MIKHTIQHDVNQDELNIKELDYYNDIEEITNIFQGGDFGVWLMKTLELKSITVHNPITLEEYKTIYYLAMSDEAVGYKLLPIPKKLYDDIFNELKPYFGLEKEN